MEELASQKDIEVASMVRTYEETHQELVTPSDLMVIGADTIVSCGGQILGQPKDERDACRMLKLLSGGTHQVYTGVSVSYTHLTVCQLRSGDVCTVRDPVFYRPDEKHSVSSVHRVYPRGA